MQPRGRTLLKVIGILYTVFAAISILGGILLMIGGGLLSAGLATESVAGGVVTGMAAAFGGIIIIVSSLLGLIAGICGIKYCDKPEKAQTCFILGVILLIFAAIGLIRTIMAGEGGLFSSILGFILPVLYTLGANQNKQDYLASQNDGGYGDE